MAERLDLFEIGVDTDSAVEGVRGLGAEIERMGEQAQQAGQPLSALQDDIDAAADSADGIASSGKWAQIGQAIVAGLAPALQAAGQLVSHLDEIERRRDIAFGGNTSTTDEITDTLLGESFGPDFAVAGAAAAQRFGTGDGFLERARVGAAFARAGGDPSNLMATARQFGFESPEAIGNFADVLFAGAGAQDADLNATTTALRDYGPVLAQGGLGLEQSLAMILDLERAGIASSRVMPGINQLIRRESERGIGGMQALQNAQAAILAADPERQAYVAQQHFGAEGGLRLGRAISQGFVDFNNLDLSELEGSLGLMSVDPTREEIWAADRARSDQVAAMGAIVDAMSGIPLIGDVAREGLMLPATIQSAFGGGSQMPIVIMLDPNAYAEGVRVRTEDSLLNDEMTTETNQQWQPRQ